MASSSLGGAESASDCSPGSGPLEEGGSSHFSFCTFHSRYPLQQHPLPHLWVNLRLSQGPKLERSVEPLICFATTLGSLSPLAERTHVCPFRDEPTSQQQWFSLQGCAFLCKQSSHLLEPGIGSSMPTGASWRSSAYGSSSESSGGAWFAGTLPIVAIVALLFPEEAVPFWQGASCDPFV